MSRSAAVVGGAVETMPVVLVIEDEPVLRSSMVRGLARLPSLEVVDAGTLDDARRLVDAMHPSLVISDLDLPDGNGVEVVGILDKANVHCPILFVSAYVGTFGRMIPRRKNIVVLEKPVSLERLRTEVMSLLKVDATGEQAPFSGVEYMQIACLGRHSVRLCFLDGFEEVGEVVVYEGAIWSARKGAESGELALRQLLYGEGLRVAVRAMVGEIGPPMFEGDWQSILLELARVHDEAQWNGEERPRTRSGLLSSEELLDKEWGAMLDAVEEASPPALKPPAPPSSSALLSKAREAVDPGLAPPPSSPPMSLAKAVSEDVSPSPTTSTPMTLAKAVGSSSSRRRRSGSERRSGLAEPRSEPQLASKPLGKSATVERAIETSNVRAKVRRDASEVFEELYNQGIDALLGKRYDEALHFFQAAAEIKTNRSLEANLKRLRDLGYGAKIDG